MKNILVLGDSHSEVFKYIQNNKLSNRYNFITVSVGGATSQGVNNPNSKTNSLIRFQQALQNTSSFDYVLIMLGEVDCGFTIWYYADNYNVSVEEQLERSLNGYKKFLNDHVHTKFSNDKIILAGSILPTIKDQTDKRLLMGERAKVKTGILERTKLTLEYNNKLKEICNQNNYNYIDITKDTYDFDKKQVKQEYLNEDPYDHHLDNKSSSKLWINELNKIIEMDRQIVICGYPRSGTTLFYNMMRGSLSNFNFMDDEVSGKKTITQIGNYCTKRPLDMFALADIYKTNFKNKKIDIIFSIRDPRSVLLSMHKSVPDDYFCDGDYQYFVIPGRRSKTNPGIIPIYKQMKHVAKALSAYNNVYFMKYEDLITNTDNIQEELSSYFNLKFTDSFENFHKKEIPDNLKYQLNGVREIDTSRLTPWKDPKYKERIKDQFTKHPELFDILIDYGYEKDNSWFEDFR